MKKFTTLAIIAAFGLAASTGFAAPKSADASGTAAKEVKTAPAKQQQPSKKVVKGEKTAPAKKADGSK